MSRALGLDISWYQDRVMPFSLLKAGGIDFVVVKCDARTQQHFPVARSAGMVSALYYWNDPTQTPSAQVNRFASFIETYHPDFVALDVEQWWSDWGKYWQAVNGEIPWSQVPRFTSAQISENARAVAAQIAQRYPNLRLVIYTGYWFIQQYSPDMNNWIGIYPAWLAQYVHTDIRRLSYAQLRAMADGLSAPTLPPGLDDWNAWQFSSRVILPDYYARLDCNIWHGTIDELRAWIAGANPPPPPPPQPPAVLGKVRVTASPYINLRAQPSASAADKGDVAQGVEPYVFEESAPWVRVAGNAWLKTGAGLADWVERYG